jgi:cytochrome P450
MTSARTQLPANFDPWAPGHLGDPFAVYSLMRETDPMHYSEARNLWFCSRYADVNVALKDHQRLSTAVFHLEKPHMRARPADGRGYQGFDGPTVMTTEPPAHTRLRRHLAPGFTPRALQRLRERVTAITNDLLDRIEEDGRNEVDLIEAFAHPLPVHAIAELLGVPSSLRQRFLEITTSAKESEAHNPDASAETLAQAAETGAALAKLVEEIVDEVRGTSAEGLLPTMVEAQSAHDLTLTEIQDAVHLLLEAGHITTVHQIGNSLELLLDRRDMMQTLVASPDLMPSAVEELLRLVGPVHFTGRTAREDVVVGGQELREGECVILLLPAANRDPRQFDDPESLDFRRSPNRHLAFGTGVHVCIGAALARLETAIALQCLLSRFPRLARTGPPNWGTSFELRGLNDLNVALSPG